jgi:urocanate hydratase
MYPSLQSLTLGIPVSPLPPKQPLDPLVPHAPIRNPNLNANEKKIALKNALRYFDKEVQQEIAEELLQELE